MCSLPVQSVPSGGCGQDHYSLTGTLGKASWKRESGPYVEGEAGFQRVVEVLFIVQGMLEMSAGEWPA